MTRQSILIRFDGQAGDGVLSSGQLLARAAARAGYEVLTQSFFLSEVRGGSSTFQVRLSCSPILSPGERPDVVIALDEASAIKQSRELATDGLLMHPTGFDVGALTLTRGQDSHGVNWKHLAAEAGASARSQNVVAAGVAAALVGLAHEPFALAVAERFSKDRSLAEANTKAMLAGYDHARHLLNGTAESWHLATSTGKPLLLLSGNEAVALGALVGGIRFYAGYPITPASEIMELMAKHLPRMGGHFVQAEDEIAALAMCLGASYGGHPSLTATSGPGLSLMCELIGLAAMAELPVVIADVQRAGPSTGMPTKDGQGDLNLAIYGSHGDAPRAVLAAQTVADCFRQTVRAVSIAREYQIPVILLSSQAISHSQETVALPALDELAIDDAPEQPQLEPGEYRRYRQLGHGQASVRAIPGTPGGMHRTGGLEHDETGIPSADPANRVAMVERRAERLQAIAREHTKQEAADLASSGHCAAAVVGWGRAASSAREATATLRASGFELGSFFPHLLWPVPIDEFTKLLVAGAKTLYVCETNSSGQLAQLLRGQSAHELVAHGAEIVSVAKDDGTPLSPEEIRSRIETHHAHCLSRRYTNRASVSAAQENLFACSAFNE